MPRQHDYVSTRDAMNHFNVSYATVYNWIQKGWLKAERVLPQKSGANKREVGRYHIHVDEFAYFDSQVHTLVSSGDLTRYVPRVLHHKGMR